MRRPFWLSLMLILLIGGSAQAKCPLISWHVTGRVVSLKTNSGIEGAQIFIFLDESESTNTAGYGTKYPDFFLTSDEGSYSAVSYFDSFKQRFIWGGDECSRVPSIVEVVVVKAGFLTKRKQFTKSEIRMTEEEDSHKILLPDIFMAEPLPH